MARSFACLRESSRFAPTLERNARDARPKVGHVSFERGASGSIEALILWGDQLGLAGAKTSSRAKNFQTCFSGPGCRPGQTAQICSQYRLPSPRRFDSGSWVLSLSDIGWIPYRLDLVLDYARLVGHSSDSSSYLAFSALLGPWTFSFNGVGLFKLTNPEYCPPNFSTELLLEPRILHRGNGDWANILGQTTV